MSFLPAPDPDRLARSRPPLVALDGDRLVWRVYFTASEHPVSWHEFRFFGPAAVRFDHHEGTSSGPRLQNRGIYYCAPDLRTVIAETFQTKRTVSVEADAPRVVAWFPGGNSALLDLLSDWPTRAGCDQRIHSTPNRRSTQAWSRQIYEMFPNIDGLRYRSKFSGRTSWCLYERCRRILPESPIVDLPLHHPQVRKPVQAVCEALGYAFEG